MQIFKRRDGIWFACNGLWWIITSLSEDHIMGKINTWIEASSWYKTMLAFVGDNTWLIPSISTVILGTYIALRAKPPKDIESPIKDIVPSLDNLTLYFQQSIKNVPDDRFQVEASIEVDIENNTDHVIKIDSANLVLLFDKKCSVNSILYRRLSPNGTEGSLKKYPIVIQPYTTRSENIFRLDFLDVVKVKRKFINKAPKKYWIQFELVGVENTKECRPINLKGIDVKWKV